MRRIVFVSADQSARGHPAEPSRSDPEQEGQQAAGILGRLKRRADGLRSWAYQRPGGRRIWRVSIALAGLIVIIIGVVLLVVPGPGWVVIFVGIGVWATEFAWARSLLTSVQHAVQNATAWIARQPRWLKTLTVAIGLIIAAAVGIVVWSLAS
jgi:uncharacterized protein (TIGR02611 family)